MSEKVVVLAAAMYQRRKAIKQALGEAEYARSIGLLTPCVESLMKTHQTSNGLLAVMGTCKLLTREGNPGVAQLLLCAAMEHIEKGSQRD